VSDTTISRVRRITPDRHSEFVARGFKPSLFFPHSCRYLAKCGPDGFKLAVRTFGHLDPDVLWETVLFADSPIVDEFPSELFFDDEVVWHQQQFGRRGQIATANLIVAGRRLYSMIHVSDLVQRIGRRRTFKTRIENRFKGWPHMLLNAVMNFAVERQCERVYVPTADLTLTALTDPRRNPGRELFERIYDRSVQRLFEAEREDGWWVIDVERNRARIVTPATAADDERDEGISAKTICITHDIERGLGHRDVEPAFADLADTKAARSLDEMLLAEELAQVQTTYCVVGALFDETRAKIQARGHALAFHSYDHVVEPRAGADQLSRCRQVDYRVKGYRPPRSRLTAETSDENLLFHNFEWLASSRFSLGIDEPTMHRRLVKIPIAFDDFPLHRGMAYDEWERRGLEHIARSRFVAFGLHDCYAEHWLPHYAKLMARLKDIGTLKTLDQVAADVTLRNAC
jgi:hypothetical protein